ncbi:MAG TPA: type I DNA topoisomerase [Acidimicrobiales bacterium]|jgi:DNA topoisomerase-1|nr:type I DNA topoisomerase [Acidimicrobiales bacterium]
MARPLVVVESPAKAKTIARFLGGDYDVRASVGHIVDLPTKAFGVDVENGFRPLYELTDRGKQVVKELRAALKDASELYLATDEDREGEAISSHLLEHLKPRVPVRRMVFHEITKAAIDDAVANPRDIDADLVDAADTRRVLDRLYGWELSPVLWRRVDRGLSAGRVQSPAVRLVVERERERMAFVVAEYWDVDATFASDPSFTATLAVLDGQRVATGRDFGADGQPRRDVVVVSEERALQLVEGLAGRAFTVRSVESKPYRSSPKPPFMTSTLQQEGGRKLRLSASQVMRLAQGLYERGFITYMRTDNVALSEEALVEVRQRVRDTHGEQFLSPSPRQYSTKVKNAQEAHEAIRPTTPLRSPAQVEGELNSQELALYRMIWQRTLASQMADATGTTVSVRLGATAADGSDCEVAASGTTITFPGYRQVYVESRDEGDSPETDGEREALLPALSVGDSLPVETLTANGHATSPPARYTEASLVKQLEELGIGRPSTWASIMSTILDRGYVWKKGQALVPTWTAFAVVNLLEQHFDEYVDYAFTARLEDVLDGVARQTEQRERWLEGFYFGDEDDPGLKRLVEEKLGGDQIDAADINTFPLGKDPGSGELVVVKPGKYGPYVKRGEDTAGVPEDLPPADLTLDVALELLAAPKRDEPIGELDGLPVYAKSGRFGPYVQWGDPDVPPPGHDKPKMASLFQTMTLERLTYDDAVQLLSLPRVVGTDPEDGIEVVAANGRYGPYVQKGKETRSLPNEEALFTVTLDEALALLRAPKQYRGRAGAGPKPPLREFGPDPVSGRPVVAKEGRFGVYVTDGETNASIGRGDRVEDMVPERAYELLAVRRERLADTGGTPAKKSGGTRQRQRPAKAKQATAKKSAAKRPAAKRSAPPRSS